MRILVCVKRVPTDGRQDRPHRGRAGDRDEAPRVHDQPARGVRRRGGRPTDRGARRRVGRPHARPAGGRGAAPRLRWHSGPTARSTSSRTARSGTRRRQHARSSMRSASDETANGPFDLVFFGNESADSGNFQIGIRVAHALGRPVATGLKGVVVEDGRRCAASRRSQGAATSTRCLCPRSSPCSKG